MDSQKRDLAYGVFDGDEHESAGRAVTMGAFVGSAWAVAAILAWVMSEAVASGGLDESTRGAASWVLACLAGGVLQQLWFNFRPTSRLGYGGARRGLWRHVLRRAGGMRGAGAVAASGPTAGLGGVRGSLPCDPRGSHGGLHGGVPQEARGVPGRARPLSPRPRVGRGGVGATRWRGRPHPGPWLLSRVRDSPRASQLGHHVLHVGDNSAGDTATQPCRASRIPRARGGHQCSRPWWYRR